MKTKITLIVIGLLLASVLFYWFQYRPSKIRSFCDWKAKSSAGWDVGRYTKSNWAKYEVVYASCLHEKGLK